MARLSGSDRLELARASLENRRPNLRVRTKLLADRDANFENKAKIAAGKEYASVEVILGRIGADLDEIIGHMNDLTAQRDGMSLGQFKANKSGSRAEQYTAKRYELDGLISAAEAERNRLMQQHTAHVQQKTDAFGRSYLPRIQQLEDAVARRQENMKIEMAEGANAAQELAVYEEAKAEQEAEAVA